MSVYYAKVAWVCDDSAFVKRRYSRVHRWVFDEGIEVPASASPHIVPIPLSSESAVDPEEAYVAALASCHMLFFLDYASRQGIAIASYTDQAQGIMQQNQQGQYVMDQVILNPSVEYQSTKPEIGVIQNLHDQAHESCFLANSVKTKITVAIS